MMKLHTPIRMAKAIRSTAKSVMPDRASLRIGNLLLRVILFFDRITFVRVVEDQDPVGPISHGGREEFPCAGASETADLLPGPCPGTIPMGDDFFAGHF